MAGSAERGDVVDGGGCVVSVCVGVEVDGEVCSGSAGLALAAVELEAGLAEPSPVSGLSAVLGSAVVVGALVLVALGQSIALKRRRTR